MRITLFLILVLIVQTSIALAQKAKPKSPSAPAKISKTATTPPKKADVKVAAAKITDAEWKTIVSAFETEDWTQAAQLSSAAIKKLKADNPQKQLARLRYFYIFALAGQALENKISYDELQNAASEFAGKSFLMPSRRVLGNCRGRINYICPASEDNKIVRITATNLRGSAIHSFEYVKLTEKALLDENQGGMAFVGGNLQSAEVGEYKSGIKALRLVFDHGQLEFIKTP